jgi:UDPglucose 6-dehydrogenase
MKALFPKIRYAKSSREAIKGADVCLVLTEWDEFKKLTDRDFSQMKSNIIIEGRRILDDKKVKRFEGVCW